jgi:glycine dehydrogenase subunit 1
MDFIPHTEAESREMLADIGVSGIHDLVKHLPLISGDLKIPQGMCEGEALRLMHEFAMKNQAPGKLISYLGAGAYEHFSPSAIPAILTRGEFLTSYTPYQPEVSQGTLQALFEFQSLICELFAMDVANAGMYEGASALAEAVLLALRETGRKEVLVPCSLHPDYRAILNTYTSGIGVKLIDIPYLFTPRPSGGEGGSEGWLSRQGTLDIQFVAAHTGPNTAAVIVQNPNFFGIVEPVEKIAALTEAAGALYIASVNPLSLGLLTPPGEYGADIAVAEGQPLGAAEGYGGPYLGLFACKSKWLRKMPGRLVGQTVDVDGRRAFVLTLQAREQHIRREKATSNVCTTTALVGLGATIYLSLLGKQGLREAASQNLAKSHYAFKQLTQIPGVRATFSAPFFNEFVIQTRLPAEILQQKLLAKNIIGGLPLKKWHPELEHSSLWCVTETKTKADIDALARATKEALG